MLTFKNILFPVDFSERSTLTIPYVARLARRFQSRLTLLHVIDTYDAGVCGAELGGFGIEDYQDALRTQSTLELEDFGKTEFEGIEVVRIVESGDVASRIVSFARTNKVDLIVMPTHGRGAFRRMLLGSITSNVLHDAQCPVLTTAHCETLAPLALRDVKSIVCAVDVEPENERVIVGAAEAAEMFHASLHLVHAISAPEARAGNVLTDLGFKRSLFDNAASHLSELQNIAHTDYQVDIEGGSVAGVLGRAVRDYHADLLVIGRGQMSEPFGVLRTNVAAIIRESPCPVLSV
jgi:nucleotide-binding universal stress UspA family protein